MSLERDVTSTLSGDAEAVWASDGKGHIAWVEGLHASELLRSIRDGWARRLDGLTVSTPEPSLDLLVNRVLPVQVFTSPDAPVDPDGHCQNLRTLEDLRSIWDVLYDTEHALLRDVQPADGRPLPGLPENGGLRMATDVRTQDALLEHGMLDEAYLLLRAMDPILRSTASAETFRCAPYRLPGGLCAPPMPAGRAVEEGGDASAGPLYRIILHKMLGYDRQGDTVRMDPRVPPDWNDFTITLREGASTWRLLCERHCPSLTVDGDEVKTDRVTIKDDGKVHQVRFPLP